MIKLKIIILIAFTVLLLAFMSKMGYEPSQRVFPQKSDVKFKKHILTEKFVSEGATAADVNKDGKTDILAGPYWFEAPDWISHEISPVKDIDPASEYSDSFLNFSLDVNLDGWEDLIVIRFPGEPAVWYENPQNKAGHWKQHSINDSVGVGNESPNFVDIDGDGRKDILCADTRTNQIVWLKAPTSKSSTKWERHPISEKNAPGTDKFSHGIGFGDIDKDGLKDILVKEGWWKAPSNPKQSNWTFQKADFGEDCSHIQVLDVNSDGLKDVVNASAHKYGIWWHEQKKGADGEREWKQHLIHDQLSQSHSLGMEDFNRDGHPDLVTGKRKFAHNDTDIDPGTHDPASLLWIEFLPGKKPYWQVHEIDDKSGSGLNITIQDVNKNGLKDIVVSNKNGVFYFENVSDLKQ